MEPLTFLSFIAKNKAKTYLHFVWIRLSELVCKADEF